MNKFQWLLIILSSFTFLIGCNNGKNEGEYKIRIYNHGKPESEQEFWQLANRLLQPRDFDEDWLDDTYILHVGTDYVSKRHSYEETLAMTMCLTQGEIVRHKLNQVPYCMMQEVFKFSSEQEAKKRYDTWLADYNFKDRWHTETKFFELESLVDHVAVVCDIAVKRPDFGYYEETYFCDLKMTHDTYFVYTKVRFTLDEEPINREEVGELFNQLQEMMIAPDADQLPEGLIAPISFED